MTTIFDELIDNFEKDDRISKLYRFEGGKSFSKLSNGSFGFDNVGGYTYFSKSLKHHQYFMSKRLKQLINENVLNGTNLIVSKNNLVHNGSFNIILSKLDHCSNIHSLYSLELLTDPFILGFIKDNALIQEVKQHSMYSDIPELVDRKVHGGGYGLSQEYLELLSYFTYFIKVRELRKENLVSFLKNYRLNVLKNTPGSKVMNVNFIDDMNYRIFLNPHFSDPFTKYRIMNCFEEIYDSGEYLDRSKFGNKPKDIINGGIDSYEKAKEKALVLLPKSFNKRVK